ncbi:MAG: hypothetical protein AUG84_02140 [Chloroflexi bacterium 13_1_20CM_4_66_7]|nr:MAG: hypothetical protein AUG84_02140 [Chloroflexi bacterium 13_1_20CM_4_66_7]
MTEIAELVYMNVAEEAAKDKCPFCYKAPHSFPGKGKSKAIKSKPNQLNCADVPNGSPGKHTTAKHHLICAIQCFAKVKRLARMATMIGYDINDPPNGLGLPTFRNPYGGKKYSDLSDEEKQTVASRVMKTTGAQWHVGHHAVEISLPDDWDVEEGGEDNEYRHQVSYDTTVIRHLIALTEDWAAANPCEDESKKHSALKNDLDQLSERIRNKLQAFKVEPKRSSPYFVSERAFTYAQG